jgi:type III secretion protein J
MHVPPFLSPNKHLFPLYYFLVLCFCLPLLTSCESRKTIVNGLDEKEANEIIVVLSTKGIDATKVQSTEGAGVGGTSKMVLWDISVNSNQALEALSFLNQSGLPRRRSQNLLGIFTGAGLVPSEMEQKIRYQAGLAEQIASTIRKIDGILDAEVQISFPEEDPLNPGGEKKQKITASVYVKHSGVLDDPNSHLVTKIKRLVAASVTGLDYDNVTVISERARFTEFPLGIVPGAAEEEKQYVSIWSLIIAKDSAARFRIIFFSFTLLILILFLILLWIIWKIYPLIKSKGGVKELFQLKPLQLKKEEAGEEISEEQPTKETESKEEEGEKDDRT